MESFRTILHPTDFSPASDEALRAACALAGDGGTLVLLHVVPMEAIYGGVMGVPTAPEVFENALLEKLSRLAPPGLQARMKHLVREGDPATEIVRTADEEGCDAIVIGSHGRSALGKLLMGSVAEGVLRMAESPVLVVKAAAVRQSDVEPEPRQKTAVEGKSVYLYLP